MIDMKYLDATRVDLHCTSCLWARLCTISSDAIKSRSRGYASYRITR